MKKIKANGKYEIILTDHRAERPEWQTGWESVRIDEMVATVINADDPIVLDIGAEEGDISAILAMQGAFVYMVEPNEKVLPNIREIWEANKIEGGLVFNGFVGLSDAVIEDGDFVKPSEIEGDVVSDHGFSNLHENVDKKVISLDRILSRFPINIITIDVEGAEYSVLSSGLKKLKQLKPIVYVSVHPEFMFMYYEKYTAELTNMMQSVGYRFEVLAFDHELHFKFY